MVTVISEFLGVLGFNLTPPVDFSTLIPWLFYILVAIAIIAFIFKMFSAVVRSICGRRWF